ncbi:hypothetical protein WG901_17945 [Novosphingobium sp. PS1R-30]|uniref:Uncharacterized protein n=1 Tax=Novosphingobium anseongense TaxID=3133436 RepID=A0ABU8RZM8_9SPHN
MHARRLILSVLAGGPLLGMVMGFAADPEMVPLPEPSWRQAKPDPIFTERQAPDIPVFAPTYVTSNTYADRTPSWKRRPIEYGTVTARVPEPEPIAEAPEPVALVIRPATTPLDEAAEARNAARAAAEGAQAEPQPAAVEPEAESATIG